MNFYQAPIKFRCAANRSTTSIGSKSAPSSLRNGNPTRWRSGKSNMVERWKLNTQGKWEVIARSPLSGSVSRFHFTHKPTDVVQSFIFNVIPYSVVRSREITSLIFEALAHDLFGDHAPPTYSTLSYMHNIYSTMYDQNC